MGQVIVNRVLIPADTPGRVRLERVLRDEGWQPLAYGSPGEAERVLAEGPATAILLSDAVAAPVRSRLVKKFRDTSPEMVIMGAGASEAQDDAAALTESNTPEEIAMAVRMGHALRRVQTDAVSLRSQIQALEDRTRDQVEQIQRLESACENLRDAATNAQEMALRDPLTGLYNRRHFLHAAERELERARREKGRFAIAMADIDHFKACNDTLGHVAGDRLLQEFSAALLENVRRMDTVARYGGEEFIMLLPGTYASRSAFDATGLLERLRQRVEKKRFREDDDEAGVHLTLSAGIVEYPKDGESVADLIAEADARLYRAKVSGRNRICASGE